MRTSRAWQKADTKAKRNRVFRAFKKLDHKLQGLFPKFYYKQKVIEEMALVAENIHDKLRLSQQLIGDWEKAASFTPATSSHPGRAAQDQGAGGIRAHARAGITSGPTIS